MSGDGWPPVWLPADSSWVRAYVRGRWRVFEVPRVGAHASTVDGLWSARLSPALLVGHRLELFECARVAGNGAVSESLVFSGWRGLWRSALVDFLDLLDEVTGR